VTDIDNSMGGYVSEDIAVTGPELLAHTWWSLLEDRAARVPGKVAFHVEGPDWAARLTFGTWHRLARIASVALHRAGVGAGDTVAMLAPGSPAWMIVQAACSRIGAILVPVNSRYRQDELRFVLGLTRPTVIVHIARIRDEAIAGRLRPVLDDIGYEPVLVEMPSCDVDLSGTGAGEPGTWAGFLATGAGDEPDFAPRDPADAVLMQFTSGTTAFPKGALLGSASTLRATYELGRRMGLTEADVMYSTQPMYHVGGSVATTLMALTIGCAMVVPERYSAEETFRLIARHGVTARTGQAAMYAMEMAHPDFDPATFATVTKGWSGGTTELKRAIVDRMGITGLVSMYGLTEAAASTMACAHDDPLDVRLRSSGHVLPDIEVAVFVDGVRHDAPDTVGELCIRGWPLMIGYYRNEEATRAAIDPDGWLHTGDLVTLDADGNLYFVGRIKEMLKPGGENVSPAEIERVVDDLDGVVQSAVVGRPDERLGEVPVAFVEREIGATITEQEIIDACTARMASFKVPRAVFFVTEWPMTESGKIVKGDLRASLSASGTSWVGPTG